MAFPFGGLSRRLLAAGATRSQIRGYCQKVPSDMSEFPYHRGIFFLAGGATSFAYCHFTLGYTLKEIREMHRARKLKRES